jgi:hypothetical protein
MADDLAFILRHQRKVVGTRGPQGVDQFGFGAALESGQIDGTDYGVVFMFFGSNGDHGIPSFNVGFLMDTDTQSTNKPVDGCPWSEGPPACGFALRTTPAQVAVTSRREDLRLGAWDLGLEKGPLTSDTVWTAPVGDRWSGGLRHEALEAS